MKARMVLHDTLADCSPWHAVATAHIQGCSGEYDGDKLVKYYTDEHKASAAAIVDVWVSASAKCKTYGAFVLPARSCREEGPK